MRIYLPATTTLLRALLDTGALGPAPLTAFAVTPGLREWYVDDDAEELEYAALDRGRPRVAAAASTPTPAPPAAGSSWPPTSQDASVEVRDDLDRGVVRVGRPVAAGRRSPRCTSTTPRPRRRCAAAAAAIIAADLGDDAAQDAVDDAEGFELSWYANQEIAALLDTALTRAPDRSDGARPAWHDRGMDAVTFPPPPTNEPVRDYAPGSAERDRLQATLAQLAGETAELTMTIGGAPGWPAASRTTSCRPHRHELVLGETAQATRADVEAAIGAALAAAPGVARAALRRAGRGVPARRRPAVDDLARPAQRRDHARPVEERAAGRDRLGVRAGRLPALQRALRPRRSSQQQPVSARADVEPDGLPAARGLRPRDHPVQLHRDRRQPAVRAGAAGQRRRVEAVARPSSWPRTTRCSCSRRPACRRASSTSSPATAQAVSEAAVPHPALAGIHFTGSTATFQQLWSAVGERIGSYATYPRLVGETGGKDFVVAHPSADPAGAGDGAGARRVRVPGPEVLGGVAGVRAALAVGRRRARRARRRRPSR